MADDKLNRRIAAKPPALPFKDRSRFLLWLRTDKLFVRSYQVVMALLFIVLIWIIFAPPNANHALLDRILTILPIPIIMFTWLVMGSIARRTTDRERKRFRSIGVAACLVVFVPEFFLGADRSDYTEKLEWDCEGTIVERYSSHNHGALSIMVSGTKTARLEGIEMSFYEVAKVGDVVIKKPWSEYALLNGHPLRILHGRTLWSVHGKQEEFKAQNNEDAEQDVPPNDR